MTLMRIFKEEERGWGNFPSPSLKKIGYRLKKGFLKGFGDGEV